MSNQPDIIIVGAGHNGLVAGAYLAKAGRKVLVLERRESAGGQLGTVALESGIEVPALHAGAQLRPAILRELGLSLPVSTMGSYAVTLPGGQLLQLGSSLTDTASVEAIRRVSARDAARWPEFVTFMNTAAGFIDSAYQTPMPRLPNVSMFGEGLPLAQLALKLRRLGRRDMFRVIRSLSMSAVEFTEEWFESEAVRSGIAAVAIHGVTLGSMSAGTGYTLMHNWLNRGGLGHSSGDGRAVTAALLASIQTAGGTVRTGTPVAQILVEHQQVRGVRLTNGEEIKAATVISSADPRHTLLELVGAPELPPEFVWHASAIKMRGSVAKIHALTDGSHGIPAGTVAVAPGLKYLERAYDAAKYGEISKAPYLEVTTAGNVVSMHFQFAPYQLRHSDWNTERAGLERLAIDTLGAHFPAFSKSVREIRSITPLDLQQTWGLTEGDLNHGQLILDQALFMRPIPGWSDHRTPVDGLYLCGSGVHGGGGISGTSGRNAAQRILKR
jgi:phytoene dehydrogenase-like protein